MYFRLVQNSIYAILLTPFHLLKTQHGMILLRPGVTVMISLRVPAGGKVSWNARTFAAQEDEEDRKKRSWLGFRTAAEYLLENSIKDAFHGRPLSKFISII